MNDQGCIPIGFDQVASYLLSSSPNLQHHQQQKQLSQYSHHHVTRGHHHCQLQSFEVPLGHRLTQGQAVSVGSYASPSSVMDARKMFAGDVRRVSRQDIQLALGEEERPPYEKAIFRDVDQVQNLIERCLQLYMNQKEVIYTLFDQAKIEPGFTELVWQKLEEQNREFFKAYHVRLMVKNQIEVFNDLLVKQVELMQKICPTGVASMPISNGSHSALQRTSRCYAPEHSVAPSAPDQIHHPMGGPSSILINGGNASMHRGMHSVDEVSTHTGRMDIPQNMLMAQNTPLAILQGANGVAIKSEPGYSNAPAFTFGADASIIETRPTIGDASASFSSTDSNSQAITGPLVDADASSYGFLGQIPRNFSLSDLTADFSQSSDILESYSRSPFLPADTDDFLHSPDGGCQGEEARLDTISEGLSYEEFGSD